MSDQTEGPMLCEPPKPAPYYSCSWCKHLTRTLYRHSFIGGSEYWHYCNHPAADTRPQDRLDNGQLVMRLETLPRRIPNTWGTFETHTPDWCPFLQEKKDDHEQDSTIRL